MDLQLEVLGLAPCLPEAAHGEAADSQVPQKGPLKWLASVLCWALRQRGAPGMRGT
jgi:hypothetical protein